MFMLYCKSLLLLLRLDTVEVRDRLGGLVRFKGGLRCSCRDNSILIIIDVNIAASSNDGAKHSSGKMRS